MKFNISHCLPAYMRFCILHMHAHVHCHECSDITIDMNQNMRLNSFRRFEKTQWQFALLLQLFSEISLNLMMERNT